MLVEATLCGQNSAMKAVQYNTRGVPSDVVSSVDIESRALSTGEARVAVLASPINPSDLLMLSGHYALLPPLPAIGGSEGVGRVLELADGNDSAGVSVGQIVALPLGTAAWQEQVVVSTDSLVALPDGADVHQLSMLGVNPPTASLLLGEHVALNEGDWVIQNAANSGVGNYVIQLAKSRGIRTLNVVRRDGLDASLRALGADEVLVDGPDLAKRVKQIIGGGARLGIDAVGGAATARIAQSLVDGGVVVNYGVLSGESCQVPPGDLIFRGIQLRGFWLVSWLNSATPAQRTELYGRLAAMVATGTLHTEIERVYGFDQGQEAIVHAMQGGRAGKILFGVQ